MHPAGTYSQPLDLVLHAGDERGGFIWYTLDPDAEPAQGSPWILWTLADPVILRAPAMIRAFSALDEYRFSAEASYRYAFAAPMPGFQPEPGGWANPISIYLTVPDLPDGSGGTFQPSVSYSLDRGINWQSFSAAAPLRLDASTPSLSIWTRSSFDAGLLAGIDPLAAADYAAWTSPSAIAEATYWLETADAGINLAVSLPDGTGINLNLPSTAVLIHGDASGDYTINVGNSLITSIIWSLNGVQLTQTGSPITVGRSGPMGHPAYEAGLGLRVGYYTLTCMGMDQNGCWHSQSFSFSVVEP